MTRRSGLFLLAGAFTGMTALAAACDFPAPMLVPDEGGPSTEGGGTLTDDGATTDGGGPVGDAAPDAIDPGIGDASGEKPPVDPSCDPCDCDKDGFLTKDAAVCPDAGPDAARLDCDDLDSRAHPDAGFVKDQPTPDTKGDWNCDGTREGEYPGVNLNCADYTSGLAGDGCKVEGFTSIPKCGAEGAYVVCAPNGSLKPCIAGQTDPDRVQGCR